MSRGVPRLIDGIHIPDPDVDEMVESGVVQGHIVRPTIQLVPMEGYQTSMVHEVVHGQPLLEYVTEVLFRVLRPKEGGIDDL